MKINELKIYSNDLASQVEFYTKVLEVECIERSEERVSLKFGSSVLIIESRPESTPYHFAINIPSNKELEALKWLKSRATILRENQTELHDFNFWNAKAMYFYDSDMNIVEFIARKNLKNEIEEPFGVDHLLCISEIGVPTIDVESKFKTLNTISNIPKYDGNYERMLAIGDENGLFICINKIAKKWFPVGDEAFSSDFELEFNEAGTDYKIKFEQDQIVQIT